MNAVTMQGVKHRYILMERKRHKKSNGHAVAPDCRQTLRTDVFANPFTFQRQSTAFISATLVAVLSLGRIRQERSNPLGEAKQSFARDGGFDDSLVSVKSHPVLL